MAFTAWNSRLQTKLTVSWRPLLSGCLRPYGGCLWSAALRIGSLVKHLFADSLFKIQQTHWAQLGERKGKAGSPVLILPLRPRQMFVCNQWFSFLCVKATQEGGAGEEQRERKRTKSQVRRGREGRRKRAVPALPPSMESSPSFPSCLGFCVFEQLEPVICSH